MENSFFSVVIPLFQKEKFIARAIDSVLAQKYPYFELIIVDDGSTDKGADVVLQYHDQRIKLVKQANLGVSAARNKGISEATTDYVALLDADDKWEPDFLLEMKRLIETYPGCGWYSCGWTVLYNNRKQITSSSRIAEGKIVSYFDIAFGNEIINSSSVVLPKEVIISVGGFPVGVKHREDLFTWIIIASKYSICFTPKHLSWYFCDENDTLKRLRHSEPDLYYQFIEQGNETKNEFLTYLALHKGILDSIYGDRIIAKIIEQRYSLTKQNKKMLSKLKRYNSIPQLLLFGYFSLFRLLVLSKRRLVDLLNK